MDLLRVTKDGNITSDYWNGLREIESARISIVLQEKEQKQREEYTNAIRANNGTTENQIKTGRKKRKTNINAKPTMREIYGEQIERLFVDGFTMKQIASTIGISAQTVSKILIEMKKGK